MAFVFRMAARELRASWRRLVFFFICVAIGVAAIVSLRSIIQSLRAGLVGEARSTIAADVLVQSNRPWEPEVSAALEARFARAPILDRTRSIETATMVRAESGAAVARMVELRGVERGFPFYGTLNLQNGTAYSHELVKHGGALVRPELLTQLGVEVGGRIIIGGRPFTIRGVIEQEPGRRVGGFSFGSRVLVDLADLEGSGLLSFGSRATYQILLKVRDDGVEPLTRDIRRGFRDRFVSARSYKSTEDRIGENLQRAENFLSLVGFVIVVLGGIGVWSVTRVFVRQKMRSVAILKCIGASTAKVLGTYVLQVGLLAMGGSLVGVLLAGLAMRAIPASLAASFGGLSYGLTGSAVLQGLTVGLLVSLLFALVPLLDVRRIKPLLLIRGADIAPAPSAQRPADAGAGAALAAWFGRLDWLQVGTAALVGGALVAVASWQAGSWRAGAAVSVGFAAVSGVLYGAAFALVTVVRPLASAPWFPLRHAVISLRRPGNQTRVILLAVGLGSFFVLGVRALQDNLIAEFEVRDRGGADMFLIDIQRDQVDGVRAMLEERPGAAGSARLMPVLRARITAVRGREMNLATPGDVRGQGSLAREYTVTYRENLEANEEVIDGAFWKRGDAPAAAAEVSIEQSIHDRFNINVGDDVQFDVLGRTITARVTSVRRVEWAESRAGGFMFVFRPGVFADAPHTFVGFVKGPDDATARARLQYDLVSRFPNVTAIDGREILARIQAVVDNAVLGISIVGGVALLSGVLILIGAVAMTKFQRVYEAAILRTLGAGTGLLTTTLALEYCALGLLAGIIGAIGALGLSWGVTRHVLEIPWRPAPGVLSAGAVLTMLLVGVVGILASADVLRKKPLATLRAE